MSSGFSYRKKMDKSLILKKKLSAIIAVLIMIVSVMSFSLEAHAEDKVDGKGVNGQDVVEMARQYIGKVSYVYGGNSLETGTDCSGFCVLIYEKFGVNLWPYRSSDLMEKYMDKIGVNIGNRPEDARAGDLVIYSGHVALATNDGTLIHALNSRNNCAETGFVHDAVWRNWNGGVRCIIRPYNIIDTDPDRGIYKDKDYGSVFNYYYYVNRYPDLKEAFGDGSSDSKLNALTHFINRGMREGRQASEDFNPAAYKYRYPELAEKYGDDNAKYYEDYMESGIAAKRDGSNEYKYDKYGSICGINGNNYSAVFDYNFFVENYPEAAEYMKDYITYMNSKSGSSTVLDEDDIPGFAICYFEDVSMKQGKQANAIFDPVNYRLNHRELWTDNDSNDMTHYYLHYIQYHEEQERYKSTLLFSDVYNPSLWYYNMVKSIYEMGIMVGDAKPQGAVQTSFRPEANISRGEFVVTLYRMAGFPGHSSSSSFPDVSPNKFYYDAICWAQENGIVRGYNNGNFGPEDDVKREEIAVFLNRYMQYKGKAANERADVSRYPDNASLSFGRDAVSWAVGAGVLAGKNIPQADGSKVAYLAPKDNATRAECATMIVRFINKFGK